MQPEREPSHSWVKIGATYGAVVEDEIAALVYHAEAKRGRRGGPGGDGALTDAGWFLVWTHEPHRHFQLASPHQTADMSTEKRDENAYAALAEAGEIIDDQMAREDR